MRFIHLSWRRSNLLRRAPFDVKNAELNVVIGAFGYTGKYIARKLLSTGHEVRTLTGHPGRENPFGDQIKAFPLDFGSGFPVAQSPSTQRSRIPSY